MAIHYERTLFLNKESFINFFRNSENSLTIRPVFIDEFTGSIVKDFTIITEESHGFYTDKKDKSKILRVTITSEEYIGCTSVEKLFKIMTDSPIEITDNDWGDDFINNLKYSVKHTDLCYPLEKVFNKDTIENWDTNNMENVVIPSLDLLKRDYIKLTERFEEMDLNFEIKFETHSLPNIPDVEFKFYSDPIAIEDSSIVYLDLCLTDYQGEVGDTEDELDEFLETKYGICKGDCEKTKIKLLEP